MAEPLFIAIGVHKAATLPQLDGVLTSVAALADWAAGQGYEVVRIDDQTQRVTIERIKDALTPKNPETGEREAKRLLDRPRIVVYFCGHGLHASQDQYWILSAGPNQPTERISASAFRDMLATYGPKQIACIADACRTVQVDALKGLGSPVVDSCQGTVGVVEKDNFRSTLDGQASFAVPSKNGAPAYCVFSRVLLRALSQPADPDALDELYLETGRKIVSSQSLATYLERKVPDAAIDVGKLQAPECDPGFRPIRNGYADFGRTGRDDSAILLEVSEATMADARRQAQSNRIDRSRSEWRTPYMNGLRSIMERSFLSPIYDDRLGPLLLSSNSEPPKLITPDLGQGNPIELVAGEPEPPRKWNQLFQPAAILPVNGRHSTVALACVADLYAAIPLHRDLWCAAIIEPALSGTGGGIELLAWGARLQPRPLVLSAVDALKGLSARTLTAEDVAVLAKDMRYLKHADPLYGIVAAYLYNNVGDVQSIRRMCYYYRQHHQDVPFDIAMLAQLELEMRPGRGGSPAGFTIQVPEVAEMPVEQRHADAPRWVWESTPPATVNVAGVTPLLRVGWQYIQESHHHVHRNCGELATYLTEAPIATFQGHRAGTLLVDILKDL